MIRSFWMGKSGDVSLCNVLIDRIETISISSDMISNTVYFGVVLPLFSELKAVSSWHESFAAELLQALTFVLHRLSVEIPWHCSPQSPAL